MCRSCCGGQRSTRPFRERSVPPRGERLWRSSCYDGALEEIEAESRMTASAASFAATRTASKAAPVRPPSGAHGPRLQIPSLDGLRAVSFLIVFTSHAGLDFFVPGGF